MVASIKQIDDEDCFLTQKKEIKTVCGTIHVMLDFNTDNQLQRMRVVFGKAGTCCHIFGESFAALFTVGLQSGANFQELIDCCCNGEQPQHCHRDDVSCFSRILAHIQESIHG